MGDVQPSFSIMSSFTEEGDASSVGWFDDTGTCQFMPLVGRDWSQTGAAHLFSAIKENGYQLLFLSARALSPSSVPRDQQGVVQEYSPVVHRLRLSAEDPTRAPSTFIPFFSSGPGRDQRLLARQFLFNLKQDGKGLPDGPVVTLFQPFIVKIIRPFYSSTSIYKLLNLLDLIFFTACDPSSTNPSQVPSYSFGHNSTKNEKSLYLCHKPTSISFKRRAPHEFKTACLEDIRACFPSDRKPFYAGFGIRDTDEFRYLKVRIPIGKSFIINPKGEVTGLSIR
ncbi:hypothetical protein POM88_025559 [Heracleum sosnowskyi]|uniref:LNS2/PITP domain-containing protein n=4 Tax=Magnoliopsida TaxID=3398 RepID=A0AAD8I5A3_9APIA|nr:hypothetical protein POM88_025559 [Heracleum sosnowskyi]